MTSFYDLGEVDRAVLVAASEEGLPWEACAQWSRDPRLRSAADIEITRRVAEGLVHRGLIWMYRITDGNPDVTEEEVAALLGDSRSWEYHSDGANDVALYLTPDGEKVYFGEEQRGG